MTQAQNPAHVADAADKPYDPSVPCANPDAPTYEEQWRHRLWCAGDDYPPRFTEEEAKR